MSVLVMKAKRGALSRRQSLGFKLLTTLPTLLALLREHRYLEDTSF
jgi:hypothetical protein